MDEIKNVFDQALFLADELSARSIPYAIGGALAYGLWSEPRATKDIDVNVFVPLAELPRVFDALRSLSANFDEARARHEALEQGMFIAHLAGYRVDVFIPSIDFSWEAHRTAREQTIRGHPYRFLSPEALAVFKLLFFRPKDLLDLEKLVFVQGTALDVEYVRRKMVEMMGEDDERTKAWDRIVSDYAKP